MFLIESFLNSILIIRIIAYVLSRSANYLSISVL